MSIIRCKHFIGVQHQKCEADVTMLSVRDDSGDGMYRWPCVIMEGRPPCATTCASFSAETEEEVKAAADEVDAMIVQFRERRRAGRCPTCNEAMTEQRFNRCIWAQPCGHRVGQSSDSDEYWP